MVSGQIHVASTKIITGSNGIRAGFNGIASGVSLGSRKKKTLTIEIDRERFHIIALPWIRPAREFRLYRTLEQKVCEPPEHRRRYRLSRLTNGSVPGLCVCHSDSIKSAAALAQSRDGKKSSTAESGQDRARRRQHPTRCWRHLTVRRRHPTVYWRDLIACLEDAVRSPAFSFENPASAPLVSGPKSKLLLATVSPAGSRFQAEAS